MISVAVKGNRYAISIDELNAVLWTSHLSEYLQLS